MQYEITTERSIGWQEVAALFESVGWGEKYEAATVQRSIAAYPLVAHARDADGVLVGYLTAFSDGAFSTMLGELAVHPAAQGHGIGKALLSVVETNYPSVPITVKALGDAKFFFEACGYRIPKAEVTAMFKKVDK